MFGFGSKDEDNRAAEPQTQPEFVAPSTITESEYAMIKRRIDKHVETAQQWRVIEADARARAEAYERNAAALSEAAAKYETPEIDLDFSQQMDTETDRIARGEANAATVDSASGNGVEPAVSV